MEGLAWHTQSLEMVATRQWITGQLSRDSQRICWFRVCLDHYHDSLPERVIAALFSVPIMLVAESSFTDITVSRKCLADYL